MCIIVNLTHRRAAGRQNLSDHGWHRIFITHAIGAIGFLFGHGNILHLLDPVPDRTSANDVNGAAVNPGHAVRFRQPLERRFDFLKFPLAQDLPLCRARLNQFDLPGIDHGGRRLGDREQLILKVTEQHLLLLGVDDSRRKHGRHQDQEECKRHDPQVKTSKAPRQSGWDGGHSCRGGGLGRA